MPFVNRTDFNQGKNIFNAATKNVASRNITMTDDFICLCNNTKEVPAGMFISVDYDNTIRYLPRVVLASPIDNSSPILNVSSPVFQFVPGDVIYALNGYAFVELSGTVSIGETVSIFYLQTFTVVTADTTSLSDLATKIADTINNSIEFNNLLYAIAEGDTVYIYWIDRNIPDNAFGLLVFDSSATLNLTLDTGDGSATAKFLQTRDPIGTVASVDPDNMQIILTANALGAELPTGAYVGVKVAKILGVDADQRNFINDNQQAIAVYTKSDGVNINKLPYYDSSIMFELPNLQFQLSF